MKSEKSWSIAETPTAMREGMKFCNHVGTIRELSMAYKEFGICKVVVWKEFN